MPKDPETDPVSRYSAALVRFDLAVAALAAARETYEHGGLYWVPANPGNPHYTWKRLHGFADWLHLQNAEREFSLATAELELAAASIGLRRRPKRPKNIVRLHPPPPIDRGDALR